MALAHFHPAVVSWFRKSFERPTECQAAAWPAIRAGRHTLVAAPTGSGKTLAAFLSVLDDLVRQGLSGDLPDATQVVYVSPLKALSNDIQRNLQVPLDGIRAELRGMGLPEPPIRVLVRTGDTPAPEREAMRRRPPHIVVTTPESLYILLTSEGGRRVLRTARVAIVDEIHALVRDKRGSHLALSLERLEALAGGGLLRVGLSATQRPLEDVARFLVGAAGVEADGTPRCTILDAGHLRDLDLGIEVPRSPLTSVMAGEVWDEVYDRLADLIREHRTSLVFVNTRRMSERVGRHLADRLGDDQVASHHGSLARDHRLSVERRLKAGELRALVATASLELGIDIGAVDLVCQIGSTRAISTLLQRVGRSGHAVGGFPKGRVFPTSRDELVEAAALLDSIRRGELDRLTMPEAPLDILAQQMVAAAAGEDWTEDALFALVRRAWPYRGLPRESFDAVVRMIAEGFSTRRGRRGALVHHDAVNGRLRGRRGARLAAITSGGAIPDTADYEVVAEPEGIRVGTVNEDFAVESLAGDIFQLGNVSWRILRIEPGRVRVEDARGAPPSIPFWLGEAPSRTEELSMAVSRLRAEMARRLAARDGRGGAEEALGFLVGEARIEEDAARQVVEYLAAGRATLGILPTRETVVLERFFDETGGMQLILHSPFGSRINRAWGLALRKRFCRKFNFELQAAATEDAIVLSLGPTHSFPLEEVGGYLRSQTVREVLVQALLDAPMFAVRWRWNATRALAVLRWRGGRKVPPPLQRMEAEDLLAVTFPDQLACAENLSGEREIPDHPLVRQTIRDCLEEAMDVRGLERLLSALERGEVRLVARDLTEPSPLAAEILNARPYAFLDDAPLEERRTQAVSARRWLDPETAADLGALDPAAIERVREEARPEVGSRDELHDALVVLGFVTGEEGREWRSWLLELIAERRATILRPTEPGLELWVAAERLPQLAAVLPGASLEPPIAPAPGSERRSWEPEAALVEILRGRLEGLGPVTAGSLAAPMGLPVPSVEAALVALEVEGFGFRGRFTPGAQETEWCARRLLARIHRYTLNRLRREVEPVAASDLVRFLLAWQHVTPEERVEGPEGLAAILEQLEGFEAPAAAWEGEILPARVKGYDPSWLDALCLSGTIAWARLSPPRPGPQEGSGTRPIRTTPVMLLSRTRIGAWRSLFRDGAGVERDLSAAARSVHDALARRGASFFPEMVHETGLLKSRVEEALAELVALGLVTSDGFAGLRALLTPSSRRPLIEGGKRKGSVALFGMESAGRWSRFDVDAAAGGGQAADGDEARLLAGVLLRRYGVVCRKLLEREGLPVPWRDLLREYRRLEARGEIRGGRFVAGFSGEQFALPDAVGLLRSIRRNPGSGLLASVSAADPLNLIGVVTPGARLPCVVSNRLLYRDGLPVAVLEAKRASFLVEMEPSAEWEARNALLRRSVPPVLRFYLGRPA